VIVSHHPAFPLSLFKSINLYSSPTPLAKQGGLVKMSRPPLLCRGARATSPTTPRGVVGKDASPPGDTHRGRATSPDPQP